MLLVAISLLLLVSSVVTGELISNGLSARLNGVDYFISPFASDHAHDEPVSDVQTKGVLGFVPVTVLPHVESDLNHILEDWASKDDVWQNGFFETVLVKQDNVKAQFANGTSVLLLRSGCNAAPGPYFLEKTTGRIHRVYRLYDDFEGAFSQSLLQLPNGHFQTLSAQTAASGSITIGVPSRLYFTPTAEKPLAGVRVGVKDIFALAGVKGSNGNRAWYGLYPPASRTGTAIQNLIDAGAIIVGLQKPSQFANGETPTADWVDYHAPFNPRGDGYQDTASSSAGAGSSIGSYEWLDLAVGSDTGGSIRGPAAVQGVFGNRPSHGLVSLDNVMPLSPILDTAGFLTRDLDIWDKANAAMYGDNYTTFEGRHLEYPKQLYTLDFPAANTSTGKMLHKFATDLAKLLGTGITSLDLDRQWNTSGPAEAKELTISALLNLTYTVFITKDQTRLLRDPFYEDYAAAHDGRTPFVDPAPLTRWAWGDSQPQSVYKKALEEKKMFMDWFNQEVLPTSENPKTCSSGILLHTDSTGYFGDRNRYLDSPTLPFGFSNGEISVFSEAPDSVFPIGEAEVFSTITNHTEFLPVTVDVMVAKGCDGLLVRLAKDLAKAGIIKIPKAGSSLEGGEILLR